MNKPETGFKADTITLAHGSGGRAMRDLIEQIFVEIFDNHQLSSLEDQARIILSDLQSFGDRLAFTTDSYVVDPIEFPGGNIGTLAVNGTLNDLAVSGARPLYLSCSMIIEEGLELDQLKRIVCSMKQAADAANMQIVTGDTKVVPRGKADKLFINTSGLGVIPVGINPQASGCRPGDKILVNGFIGDHGATILNARGELALDVELASDCQPLHELVECLLQVCPEVHAMRDATRGGLAAVLNEFAEQSKVSVKLWESAIPLRPEVRGVCEILGLDPLHFANEGKLVAVVPAEAAASVLKAMQSHPAGRDAAIIGEVQADAVGRVFIETGFGGTRILDTLNGEQLPRIC